MELENKVQLITYPDSLGGDLPVLNFVLGKYFPGLFKGGIHILPPFPSSGDRGFAPLTYMEIEPKFGTWNDIKKIGKDYPILLDLMVNHMSAKTVYFQDFLEKGRGSKYADLFITLDKIWKDGLPKQEDVDKIFLRRKEPYSEFLIKQTGEREKVWTTFGKTDPSEQIDIDIHSSFAKDIIKDSIKKFSENNVKIVRLDAVGYVIKKLGTSCFFVEPEIYEYLDWISELAHSFDIEILPEIHSEHKTQYEIAKKGFWIYDFMLPYFVLDAFINKTSKRLKEYLKTRPHNQFTMLDCHDGVPVKPDINGLYTHADVQKVVDTCLERGANLSLIMSPSAKDPNGFNVHQIRCSYYSMLDCDDTAYLAARAVQFFAPGIPQVYYVGLLAGENDDGSVKKTGEGREINRHNFSLEEIDRAARKDVVKKLIRLIRFRNDHPAFDGTFEVESSSDVELILAWHKGDLFTRLVVRFDPISAEIFYNEPDNKKVDVMKL